MKPICSAIILATAVAASALNALADGDRSHTTITEKTPSKAMYFDWLNGNWFGGNERKATRNLEFFKWLHDDYGMRLDIFLLDAGNLDNGPECSAFEPGLAGAPRYGGLDSPWFLERFPNGLAPLTALAGSFDCRLGVWLGPDGFGDDPETARRRIGMLEALTRDHQVALFKFDACCSNLKPANEPHFIEAMRKAFSHNPELIVLNHRIDLSPAAKPYATTFLWQGRETCIEVSGNNAHTAPHARYTLERDLPPGMQRLTEDHGVCLTSCLDFWDDDLVLQAFNRNLILAPQIYGNPWLLRDDEFPKLARIFNLHRRYNSILTEALVLPEESCGPHAVSRGNGRTRLITLRNLTWQPKTYQIKLDQSIGLETKDRYEVRQHHPVERILGTFKAGETVPVEVLPYRSCLIKIAANPDALGIQGTAWQVIREVPNKPLEIDLLGMPGEEAEISLVGPAAAFKSATVDGADASGLLKGNSMRVAFAGKPVAEPWHGLLGKLAEVPPPATVEPAAEAMFFAADNNCLEVRALQRSGPTAFPAVKNARDAFFGDAVFKRLGTWDRFAFDGDSETAFKVREYTGAHGPGVLRLRLPEAMVVDRITLAGLEPGYVPTRASVSSNLVDWHRMDVAGEGTEVIMRTRESKPFRYLRLDPAPRRIGEITAASSSGPLDTTPWRASNLFPASESMRALRAWRGEFPAMDLPETGYLCVAVPGAYGPEGAFAVLKCGDVWIGAEDRSPTYAFNNWEHIASPHGGHYTYYFRPDPSWRGRPFTVHVFGSGPKAAEIGVPEVWRTAYPEPLVRRRLVLAR